VIIRTETLDVKRDNVPIIVICNHTQIINKNVSLMQTNQTKEYGGTKFHYKGKGDRSLGRGSKPRGNIILIFPKV
jgi:hypothetical protein